MKQWQLGAGALAVLAIGLGAARLSAQNPRSVSRKGLVRNPALAVRSPQAAKAARAQALQIQSRLTGLILVFEYDPARAKNLDLDDNASDTDNGDRALREGDIWLSNRNGDKVRLIGRFVSEFEYFDADGEPTGTDLTQVTDMFFKNEGQARASGFWNVEDGNGAPALHIDGAAGGFGLRRYGSGQLILLDGELDTNEELWFLAR